MSAAAETKAIANAVATMSSALNDVYAGVAIVGMSYVTQLCDKAKQCFKGKPIEDSVIDKIVATSAQKMGWEGRGGSSRKSEARALLRQYSRLPEAVAAFTPANKNRCNWHDVVALARVLDKPEHADLPASDAAALLLTQRNGANTEEPTEEMIKKRAVAKVRSILKMEGLDDAFKKQLRVMCIEHDLPL